jgi:cyclooctat-9-en-7-ol 5-monooxygenase
VVAARGAGSRRPMNKPVAALLGFRDPVGLVVRTALRGDVVRLTGGRRPVYVASTPEAARTVLETEPDLFTKGAASKGIADVLGRGLQVSEGAHHLRERELLAPQFAHDRLLPYAQTVHHAAEAGTSGWRDGDVIDVVPAMRGITTASIVRALFSDAADEDVVRLTDAITEMASNLWSAVVPDPAGFKRTLMPAFRRLSHARAAVDSYVAEAIRTRRAPGRPGTDMLSEMLAAREAGRGMSDRDAHDEVVSLLFAGRGTITAALSWTWLLLGRHPEVERRLHEEVDRVAGAPTPGEHLPYTRAVWDEALRVYPPAWVLRRETARPATLCGQALPAGATVLVSIVSLHRDDRVFREPARFDPERFLDKDPPPPFTYLPFGAGPHGCLGFDFATMEAVLLIADIASRWRLIPVDDGEPGFARSITLRPAKPLWMRLVARR